MNTVAALLRSLSLSASHVAARSGLSVERVRAILDGAAADMAELRALSRGLRIPMRAFATGRLVSHRRDEVGILFRSALKSEASEAPATVEQVSAFVDAALRVLPQRDGPPSWLEAFQVASETQAEAERLAAQFRSMFLPPDRQDEPLRDLPLLSSQLCGIISGHLPRSRLEGASVIAGGYLFAFVAPRFLPRVLFTFAHELGHLIVHHHLGQIAVFERPSQIGNANPRNRAERFVDAFASALLLPPRGVGITLSTIRSVLQTKPGPLGDVELLYLARIFGVSFDVAARRCEQLDLLPPGSANSLAAKLRREFGSPEKRADTLGMPARPQVIVPRVSTNLLDAVVDRIEAEEVSAGWVAERLGLTIAEIFEAHAERHRDLRS